MSRGFGKLDALSEERVDAVVDAAVVAFAANDYAHASTAEIARRAGMSKSLLFFYFRTKRDLYLYVLDVLTRRALEQVVDEGWWGIDDFFELMRYAARKKTWAAAGHPDAAPFFLRAFYPRHRDLKDPLDRFVKDFVSQTVETYLRHVRWDRFREDVDPTRVLMMLAWAGDGFVHERLRNGGRLDVEELLEEFLVWLDLLKRGSYKEEYL